MLKAAQHIHSTASMKKEQLLGKGILFNSMEVLAKHKHKPVFICWCSVYCQYCKHIKTSQRLQPCNAVPKYRENISYSPNVPVT